MGSQEQRSSNRTDRTLEDALVHVQATAREPLYRVSVLVNVCTECGDTGNGWGDGTWTALVGTPTAFADIAPDVKRNWWYPNVFAARAFAEHTRLPLWSADSPIAARDLLPELCAHEHDHKVAHGHHIPVREDGHPAMYYTNISPASHFDRKMRARNADLLDADAVRADIDADIRAVKSACKSPRAVGDALRQIPWITQYDIDVLLVRPDGTPVAVVERKSEHLADASPVDNITRGLVHRTRTPFLSVFWSGSIVRARVHAGTKHALRTVHGTDNEDAFVDIMSTWIRDRILVTDAGTPVQFPR